MDVIERADVEWLTLQEAADYLRLSPHTIRAWIRHRALPAVKLSATVVRIRRDKLEAWVEINGGGSDSA